MMWFDGGWGWMWLAMVPMTALIAMVVIPWTRNDRTDRVPSPLEQLDGRLAAGDIGVDEYRSRRTELEHRS